MRHTARHNVAKQVGFTIVELLVVIAIIGVLVSLIFPAVNAARESGRKLSCQNNLKNLGLATLQYTESFKEKLPSIAMTNRPNPWENLSWRYQLLPFLDSKNLHDRFTVNAAPLAVENVEFAAMPVGVFECPSTPGSSSGRRIKTMGTGAATYEECEAAASDYVAVYSVRQPQRTFPVRGAWNPNLRDPQVLFESPAPAGPDESEIDFNNTPNDTSEPTSKRHAASSLVAVRDGYSNTALIVEQAGRPNYHGSAAQADEEVIPTEGPWATSESASFSGEGINVDNISNPFGFHRAAQVVMCDGSVHTWGSDMAPEVMRALLSASGKEIINDTDW